MACAVFGAITYPGRDDGVLRDVWDKSVDRGRDYWGLMHFARADSAITRYTSLADEEPDFALGSGTWIGNRRAEPTTEWVHGATDVDVQPFTSPGGWTVAHNGTIANDKELIALFSEMPGGYVPGSRIDSHAIAVALDALTARYGSHEEAWDTAVRALRGSYAVLGVHSEAAHLLRYAANYKPLWACWLASLDGGGVVVASQRAYLPADDLWDPQPVVIPPYSIGHLSLTEGLVTTGTLYPDLSDNTLVVASGGLDSTVAACAVAARGDRVTLLHLQYGAKAQDREVQSVVALGQQLGAEVVLLSTDFFRTAAPSSLTDASVAIRTGFGGAEGAEYGHEWVPARNTVMLALAAAYAEAHGHSRIVLGNNLEESGGGYPDNEQEFINRWNDLLPYAVKPHTPVVIEQPLGALMKHEIVALGASLDAPFDLTWSCYSGGDKHCGTCGPCFMRRTAFEMNGLVDPVMEGVA
jgi:7-cyano-7-deazaguanine synthase